MLETTKILVIAGQPSITAYKNIIWWWEMGHLWGWNVLQVVKLRGAGNRGWCNLSAGCSSEKPKPKKMNVFLSSLQISLLHSFHCFIKMPEKKKNCAYVFQEWEPWKCVIYSIKLINAWNTGWYLFRRQLYLYTPTHTSGQLTVCSQCIFQAKVLRGNSPQLCY